MKVMKWSAIALAVSAGSTQFAVADAFVSDQAEAKGFIEDSSLNLLLRNYYFNRDGKEGRGDRVDWTQGFLTTYESGFTQGTVGFGVDALLLCENTPTSQTTWRRPSLRMLASANRSSGLGLLRKLMFRFEVTAISTAPRRPRMTAYIAASASAMMVGPDSVPPGRTSLP